MLKITQTDFDKISKDFKGEWTQGIWEFRGGDFPREWIGRKTMSQYSLSGTELLTEGIGFEIVD